MKEGFLLELLDNRSSLSAGLARGVWCRNEAAILRVNSIQKKKKTKRWGERLKVDDVIGVPGSNHV